MRSVWFHEPEHPPADPIVAGPAPRRTRILVANGTWAVPVEERPSGWQKLKLPDSVFEKQNSENGQDEPPAMAGTTHEPLVRRTT